MSDAPSNVFHLSVPLHDNVGNKISFATDLTGSDHPAFEGAISAKVISLYVGTKIQITGPGNEQREITVKIPLPSGSIKRVEPTIECSLKIYAEFQIPQRNGPCKSERFDIPVGKGIGALKGAESFKLYSQAGVIDDNGGFSPVEERRCTKGLTFLAEEICVAHRSRETGKYEIKYEQDSYSGRPIERIEPYRAVADSIPADTGLLLVTLVKTPTGRIVVLELEDKMAATHNAGKPISSLHDHAIQTRAAATPALQL